LILWFKAGDCDARVEHLKNCDPMRPGSMDFKKGNRRMGGKFGADGANGADSAPLASKAAKKGRKNYVKKSGKLRRKNKKATTVLA